MTIPSKVSQILMAATVLISSKPAAAACITRIQDATREPAIMDFLTRMGTVTALPGIWEGSGHKIEFRLDGETIQSRFDQSEFASVRVCTTNKASELRIETLNEAGAITDTSKIKTRPDGSIGVQNKRAPFGIWVGFRRRVPFATPPEIVEALAPQPGLQTASTTTPRSNSGAGTLR